MLPRPRGILFAKSSRALWLVGILLLLSPVASLAQETRNHVVIREDLSLAHREELATKLRIITRFPDLTFDREGILRERKNGMPGGSESARELVSRAISGSNVVVIEDASNRSEVAFCRVIPGRRKKNAVGRPPVFVIQIDFADFDRLVGDERALEAFNVGWGLLHELDHVVNDSLDAESLGETGECEAHINQMRRECTFLNGLTTFLRSCRLADTVTLRPGYFDSPLKSNNSPLTGPNAIGLSGTQMWLVVWNRIRLPC